MGPILDVICGGLAQSTEHRLAHLFRYELDKLEVRQTYESDRLDAPTSSQPGAFTDLIGRFYSLLTERVLTSEGLRQQLDALRSQREAAVDLWWIFFMRPRGSRRFIDKIFLSRLLLPVYPTRLRLRVRLLDAPRLQRRPRRRKKNRLHRNNYTSSFNASPRCSFNAFCVEKSTLRRSRCATI